MCIIVGRGKDLVISGGFNVYPKEIESEIDAMPGVSKSAVIGVPHPDFGEGVTAGWSCARSRRRRSHRAERARRRAGEVQAAEAGDRSSMICRATPWARCRRISARYLFGHLREITSTPFMVRARSLLARLILPDSCLRRSDHCGEVRASSASLKLWLGGLRHMLCEARQRATALRMTAGFVADARQFSGPGRLQVVSNLGSDRRAAGRFRAASTITFAAVIDDQFEPGRLHHPADRLFLRPSISCRRRRRPGDIPLRTPRHS